MPIDYNNKKIIPNPSDEDTRMNTTIARIIARLPSLEGKAGKVLKVSTDEESCFWSSGSGGSISFDEITGSPLDNAELRTVLAKKIEKVDGSTDFKLGIDAALDKLYYEVEITP